MTSRVLAPASYILYGAPHSLYTGKARCYLRKQRIDYVERLPSHPTYVNEIAPTIGRNIIPVIVTSSGQIIQDTIDIIDHFEANGIERVSNAMVVLRHRPGARHWRRAVSLTSPMRKVSD